MNFLFLDLSTKSTGYAISDDKGKLITYGLLTASSSNNISRIQKIQSGIIELVKQYNIEKLIAEDVHPEAYVIQIRLDYLCGFKGLQFLVLIV